jgi:hypothetical protein
MAHDSMVNEHAVTWNCRWGVWVVLGVDAVHMCGCVLLPDQAATTGSVAVRAVAVED